MRHEQFNLHKSETDHIHEMDDFIAFGQPSEYSEDIDDFWRLRIRNLFEKLDGKINNNEARAAVHEGFFDPKSKQLSSHCWFSYQMMVRLNH